MKRILLRAPKTPFEVRSAETTLEHNLIGTNSGNLIFLEAAFKILQAPGVEIEVDRLRIRPSDASRINERYEVYVVPLANAFRPSFEANLRRLTRLIERLRIPVVVLSVGVQADATFDLDRLARIEASVRAFCSAVLEKSPSIGVRGELTRDYLGQLGFRDVDVIGCPSMFLNGPWLRVEKRSATLDRDARISLNVSPYVRAMGPIVAHHVERYPNLRYVAQDIETLAKLVWGEPPAAARRTSQLPIHLSHPLFREDKARFYLDPWPWLDDLREADFSFGTRIHGNIASILAGTPAYVLTHDSRTLELARYHGIPHRPVTGSLDVDAAELFEEADYRALNRDHPVRFMTFEAFLGRHGLEHVFSHDDIRSAFETRIAGLSFPPGVRNRPVVRSRAGVDVRRLRYRARRALRGPRARRWRATLLARATRMRPG